MSSNKNVFILKFHFHHSSYICVKGAKVSNDKATNIYLFFLLVSRNFLILFARSSLKEEFKLPRDRLRCGLLKKRSEKDNEKVGDSERKGRERQNRLVVQKPAEAEK